MNRIDFARVSACALSNAADILGRLAPGGVMRGAEYVVRNPRRQDRTPGSFRINTQTGRWADFATGDVGGDLVSLWAYLRDVDQGTAAIEIATIYGVAAR